ncbi:MAG: hypothetical protein AAFX55_09645 [Bacteroidota bacterium]
MKPEYNLSSNDVLTRLVKGNNIKDWLDLVNHTKALPYGRNTNRKDFSLVWKEQKGTCSSKHAFLKYMADLNSIPNIDLILGMYKMNVINTPKIGTVLAKYHLDYIPEAHCYLNSNGQRLDVTSANSDFSNFKDDILLEKTIQPEQVVKYKVDFHKAYLKNWIIDNDIPFSFEDIWDIREQCIANLSD